MKNKSIALLLAVTLISASVMPVIAGTSQFAKVSQSTDIPNDNKGEQGSENNGGELLIPEKPQETPQDKPMEAPQVEPIEKPVEIIQIVEKPFSGIVSSPTTDKKPINAIITDQNGKMEVVQEPDDVNKIFQITDTDENRGIQKDQTFSDSFSITVPEGYANISIKIYMPGIKKGTKIYVWQKINGTWVQIPGTIVADNYLQLDLNTSGPINIYINKFGVLKEENGKKYFEYNDNTRATNQWYLDNGKWYYFKEDGFAATGWRVVGNQWYYLNDKGIMETGWKKLGGEWYYLEQNGVMKTGWFKEGKDWYLFEENGVMKTGWQLSGHKWYYLEHNGKMKTGWILSRTKWYYLNSSGTMVTGWVKTGNQWYHMNGAGEMNTGWYKEGGTWYYLARNGVMKTGWVKVGNKWYFMEKNGKMRTGWYQEGNKWYYLKHNGEMATGWTHDGRSYFFFNSSGAWTGATRNKL